MSETGRRLLLLTGVPATGKTTMGRHLEGAHGFRHLDFETRDYSRYVKRHDVREARVEELKAEGGDVVITWGFAVEDLQAVLRLREVGFDWFWFDGDRAAARRAFVGRATIPEADLDVQMDKIEAFLDPQMHSLAPIVVDVFDSHGRHRPVSEVAAEVLALA